MYEINVQQQFIARHYLIGGDWGKENFPHAHPYRLEIQLYGETLDQHGYLVDIVKVEEVIKDVLEKYADRLLNELPEFFEINPSLERFVAYIFEFVRERLHFENIKRMRIVLWENEQAYSALEKEI